MNDWLGWRYAFWMQVRLDCPLPLLELIEIAAGPNLCSRLSGGVLLRQIRDSVLVPVSTSPANGKGEAQAD